MIAKRTWGGTNYFSLLFAYSAAKSPSLTTTASSSLSRVRSRRTPINTFSHPRRTAGDSCNPWPRASATRLSQSSISSKTTTLAKTSPPGRTPVHLGSQRDTANLQPVNGRHKIQILGRGPRNNYCNRRARLPQQNTLHNNRSQLPKFHNDSIEFDRNESPSKSTCVREKNADYRPPAQDADTRVYKSFRGQRPLLNRHSQKYNSTLDLCSIQHL